MQSFDLEHTWWRSFQKCVARTKLDIYKFIIENKGNNKITEHRAIIQREIQNS